MGMPLFVNITCDAPMGREVLAPISEDAESLPQSNPSSEMNLCLQREPGDQNDTRLTYSLIFQLAESESLEFLLWGSLRVFLETQITLWRPISQ